VEVDHQEKRTELVVTSINDFGQILVIYWAIQAFDRPLLFPIITFITVALLYHYVQRRGLFAHLVRVMRISMREIAFLSVSSGEQIVMLFV
jgi:hypothetical protein